MEPSPFPALEIADRLRPVELIAPSTRCRVRAGDPLAAPAPYLAVLGPVADAAPARVGFRAEGLAVAAVWDGKRLAIELSGTGKPRTLRSWRHAKPAIAPTALALTLTGSQAVAWTLEGQDWVARSRHGLYEYVDPHDPGWLATMCATDDCETGEFGQLGLRDLRLVTHSDGTPWQPGSREELWFTATMAGPGFFDTAHSGVWSLDLATGSLTHQATHFVRREGRVFGDHASHLVRVNDGRPDASWTFATSGWGSFQLDDPHVEVGYVEGVTANLSHGTHVIDVSPLIVNGLDQPGVWDPHLVRTDGGWLVGLVAAKKFFSFGPALAQGSTLEQLTLTAYDDKRSQTEGTTVLPSHLSPTGELLVLASDGRQRRARRPLSRLIPPTTGRFVVFDDALGEVATVHAPYPSNIPWPTLARTPQLGWVMVTFNGSPVGGSLTGYGTHGEVLVLRQAQQN